MVSTIEDFNYCSDVLWEQKQHILVDGRQFCVSLRNGTKPNTNKGGSYGIFLKKVLVFNASYLFHSIVEF